jgi:class 3 adenylate cyclase
MGKVVLRQRVTKTITRKGKKVRIRLLNNEDFEKFNPRLLSLGDLSLPSREVEAIVAVFDLSGFTNFCRQVDPHLAVPEFLSRFLDWLFNEIKNSFVQKDYKEGKRLWTELPFLAKFLGDGVLFLWDARNMPGVAICNIIGLLHNICVNYEKEFYPKIRTKIAEAPRVLRCGVARGKVFSVGNGQDYVGPCINLASRLQKLSNLTFCFSHRGFDIDRDMDESIKQKLVKKCIEIRGIGENEIVVVVQAEFNNLLEEEKALFREP